MSPHHRLHRQLYSLISPSDSKSIIPPPIACIKSPQLLALTTSIDSKKIHYRPPRRTIHSYSSPASKVPHPALDFQRRSSRAEARLSSSRMALRASPCKDGQFICFATWFQGVDWGMRWKRKEGRKLYVTYLDARIMRRSERMPHDYIAISH